MPILYDDLNQWNQPPLTNGLSPAAQFLNRQSKPYIPTGQIPMNPMLRPIIYGSQGQAPSFLEQMYQNPLTQFGKASTTDYARMAGAAITQPMRGEGFESTGGIESYMPAELAGKTGAQQQQYQQWASQTTPQGSLYETINKAAQRFQPGVDVGLLYGGRSPAQIAQTVETFTPNPLDVVAGVPFAGNAARGAQAKELIENTAKESEEMFNLATKIWGKNAYAPKNMRELFDLMKDDTNIMENVVKAAIQNKTARQGMDVTLDQVDDAVIKEAADRMNRYRAGELPTGLRPERQLPAGIPEEGINWATQDRRDILLNELVDRGVVAEAEFRALSDSAQSQTFYRDVLRRVESHPEVSQLQPGGDLEPILDLRQLARLESLPNRPPTLSPEELSDRVTNLEDTFSRDRIGRPDYNILQERITDEDFYEQLEEAMTPLPPRHRASGTISGGIERIRTSKTGPLDEWADGSELAKLSEQTGYKPSDYVKTVLSRANSPGMISKPFTNEPGYKAKPIVEGNTDRIAGYQYQWTDQSGMVKAVARVMQDIPGQWNFHDIAIDPALSEMEKARFVVNLQKSLKPLNVTAPTDVADLSKYSERLYNRMLREHMPQRMGWDWSRTSMGDTGANITGTGRKTRFATGEPRESISPETGGQTPTGSRRARTGGPIPERPEGAPNTALQIKAQRRAAYDQAKADLEYEMDLPEGTRNQLRIDALREQVRRLGEQLNAPMMPSPHGEASVSGTLPKAKPTKVGQQVRIIQTIADEQGRTIYSDNVYTIKSQGPNISLVEGINPTSGKIERKNVPNNKLVPAESTPQAAPIELPKVIRETEGKTVTTDTVRRSNLTEASKTFNALPDDVKENSYGRFYGYAMWDDLSMEQRKAIAAGQVPPPIDSEKAIKLLEREVLDNTQVLTNDPIIKKATNMLSDVLKTSTDEQARAVALYDFREIVRKRKSELRYGERKPRLTQEVRYAREKFPEVEAEYQKLKSLQSAEVKDQNLINAQMKVVNDLAHKKTDEWKKAKGAERAAKEQVAMKAEEALEADQTAMRAQGIEPGQPKVEVGPGEPEVYQAQPKPAVEKYDAKGVPLHKPRDLSAPNKDAYKNWNVITDPDKAKWIEAKWDRKYFDVRRNAQGQLEVKTHVEPKAEKPKKGAKEKIFTAPPSQGTTQPQVEAAGQAPVQQPVQAGQPQIQQVTQQPAQQIFTSRPKPGPTAPSKFENWTAYALAESEKGKNALKWPKDQFETRVDDKGWLWVKRKLTPEQIKWNKEHGIGGPAPAAQPPTGRPATTPATPTAPKVTEEQQLASAGWQKLGKKTPQLEQMISQRGPADDFEFKTLKGNVWMRRKIFTQPPPSQTAPTPPVPGQPVTPGGVSNSPLASSLSGGGVPGAPSVNVVSSSSSGGSGYGNAIQDSLRQGRESQPKDLQDMYRKIMERIWDSTYQGRRQAAENVRTRRLQVQPGSTLDFNTQADLIAGATGEAIQWYQKTIQQIRNVAADVPKDDIAALAMGYQVQAMMQNPNLAGRTEWPAGFRQLQDVVDNINETLARLGPEKAAKAQNAIAIMRKVYYDMIEKDVIDHTMSRERADFLHQLYPDYNPISYVQDAEDAMRVAGVNYTGHDVVWNGLRRYSATGTNRPLKDTFEVMAEEMIRNTTIRAQNRLAQSYILNGLADPELAPFIKEDMAAQLIWTPTGPVFRSGGKQADGYVSMFVNGDRKTYHVTGPARYIYDELIVLPKVLKNPLISIASWMNSFSRTAFTGSNPVWWSANVAIDMFTAFIREGVSPTSVFMKQLTAWRGEQNKRLREIYRMAGAWQERAALSRLSGLATNSGGEIVRDSRSVPMRIMQAMSSVGSYTEQTTRELVFETNLNRLVPNWRTLPPEYVAMQPGARVAASKAVNATINYARGGSLVKQLNPAFLFLNANMEGMKQPLRAMQSRGGRMRLAAIAAVLVGLNIYNMSYEEYWDVPEDVRQFSLMIMLPSTEKQSDGTNKPNYLCILPKLREWSMLFAPIIYTQEQFYNRTPSDYAGFAERYFGTMSPFSTELVVPQMYGEFLQQAANWDFFRDTYILPPEQKDLPTAEQMAPWVSPTVYELSKILGVSPLRMQHGIQGITGGTGSAYLSIIDFVKSSLSGHGDPRGEQLKEEYNNLKGPTEKAKFLTNLSPNDAALLDIALKYPERGLPILTPIKERFMPGRSGQQYEYAREAAQAASGISAQETTDVAKKLREFKPEFLEAQMKDDNSLGAGIISGPQWRENRKVRAQQYEGILKALGKEYPLAAQVQLDPAKANTYYAAYNEYIQNNIDPVYKEYFLAAGWYAIQPMEKTGGDMDWQKFYAARESYVGSLSEENRAILQNYLRANMTPTEQRYERDQELLRPYWAIADTVWARYGGDPMRTMAKTAAQLKASTNTALKQKAYDIYEEYGQYIFPAEAEISSQRREMKLTSDPDDYESIMNAYDRWYAGAF